MSDNISEVTSRSWFSRVTGALGGMVTGFILVVLACIMLFWNEGKAVKTERALDEGAGAVVSVEVASVDPANNGKLVHVSGPVSVAAAPSDPLFAALALPTNTIRISRSVEMYQWAESTKIETTRKLGGGEETVTTYSYAKEWSPQHNDSAKFKQPEGHANPDFAISAESFTAERAAIGAFVFEGATLASLGTNEAIPVEERALDGLRAKLGDSIRITPQTGAVLVGKDPATPAIGDLKISLTAIVAGDASLVGKQSESGLSSFETSNGNAIFLTQAGRVSAAEMFQSAQSANSTTTWIIRVGGLLAMLAGFRMMFSIFGVIGDVVPFIGDVFRFATGLASLGLTCVLGPVVIGTAWLAYRPLWGALILLGGLAAAALFFRLGKVTAASAVPVKTAAAA